MRTLSCSVAFLLALLIGGCGGSASETPPPLPPDVDRVSSSAQPKPAAAPTATAEELKPAEEETLVEEAPAPAEPPQKTWRTDSDRAPVSVPDGL